MQPITSSFAVKYSREPRQSTFVYGKACSIGKLILYSLRKATFLFEPTIDKRFEVFSKASFTFTLRSVALILLENSLITLLFIAAVFRYVNIASILNHGTYIFHVIKWNRCAPRRGGILILQERWRNATGEGTFNPRSYQLSSCTWTTGTHLIFNLSFFFRILFRFSSYRFLVK